MVKNDERTPAFPGMGRLASGWALLLIVLVDSSGPEPEVVLLDSLSGVNLALCQIHYAVFSLFSAQSQQAWRWIL